MSVVVIFQEWFNPASLGVADLDGIFDSAWQVLNGISAVY
jgi:hypothetical protein